MNAPGGLWREAGDNFALDGIRQGRVHVTGAHAFLNTLLLQHPTHQALQYPGPGPDDIYATDVLEPSGEVRKRGCVLLESSLRDRVKHDDVGERKTVTDKKRAHAKVIV